MGGQSTGLVPAALLLASLTGTLAFSKNFVNSSLPDSKFTFVVNFDFSQVICQHSENKSDLHVHEMSILCDGKQDCFTNPAIHDESFPYCEKKCTSTCNNRGACLYDGQRPQCYCNSGFSGPSCEFIDKNECLDRPCHLMADCLNTPVGFSCVCRPGFHGDGYHCADIDECTTPNLCPEHSNCVNLPGTHYCNCTEGFTQKGDALVTKCLDINECELGSHNCGKNQLCENTIGGFTCVSGCTEGYELANGECFDIDECKNEGVCDLRAECFNSPGSYSCVCEDGMTGDGKNCEPVTDCTQREDICDRHAQCIYPFKMCQCVAGFAGDGITCNDINECEASEEPCKNQKGSRCVNIVGGHICCEEGSDDARCIEEQGVFCAGGCGLNAYCGNKTCECLPGYSGDPLKKCLDVNECDADNLCPGVGQWCVNVFGSYLCCRPDSTEPECQGVHIFRNSDGTTSVLHSNHSKEVVVSAEQGEHSVSQQGGFIAIGRGVIRANGSLPSISALSRRACTSYCPINSECVGGYCECSKGFGGNPHIGCEDINECEMGTPCGEQTDDNWCVNTEGSFTCCSRASPEDECIGLEIIPGPGGGLRLVGGQKDDQIFHANVNESSKVEEFSEKTHQYQNASEGGAILLVKQTVPTDVTILKPEEGEMGLEITGKEIRKEQTRTPSSQSPVTLPGIISTIGGLSSSTTAIPVTEIPIHIPEVQSSTKDARNGTSGTTVLILPSTLSPKAEIEGSGLEGPEDGDMLQSGKTTTQPSSTLTGNINVHFTTLEEITRNPNETRTTVGEKKEVTKGPTTVIDGDGHGQEATVDGKGPKTTIDGDEAGDVSVDDRVVGTTAKPVEEEPNPDKEGLEIVHKPTKPVTDVSTVTPSETSTTGTPGQSSSAPTKITTDGETGTAGSDKPDLVVDNGETSGHEHDDKTPNSKGIKSGISGKEENGSSGSASSSSSGTVLATKGSGSGKGTASPDDETKIPETDIHGGDKADTLHGEKEDKPTTEPTTSETGLEIKWEGTTSQLTSEITGESSLGATGSTLPTTIGAATQKAATATEGSTTSTTQGTTGKGESNLETTTEGGQEKGPDTDIHDGENPESTQGEDGKHGKKATTEPTTGETGLEIIYKGTATPLPTTDTTLESSSTPNHSVSETVTPSSTTTSDPVASSSTETPGTVGTTREGHVNVTIGPTGTITEETTPEAGLEIIHEVTIPTAATSAQPDETTTATRGETTTTDDGTSVTSTPRGVSIASEVTTEITTMAGTASTTPEEGLEIVGETTKSTGRPAEATTTLDKKEEGKETTAGTTAEKAGTSTTAELTATPSTEQPDLVLTVNTRATPSSTDKTAPSSSTTAATTATTSGAVSETTTAAGTTSGGSSVTTEAASSTTEKSTATSDVANSTATTTTITTATETASATSEAATATAGATETTSTTVTISSIKTEGPETTTGATSTTTEATSPTVDASSSTIEAVSTTTTASDKAEVTIATTGTASTGETGSGIVPEETTLSVESTTTEQPDLILTATPTAGSSLLPSSSSTSPAGTPSTATAGEESTTTTASAIETSTASKTSPKEAVASTEPSSTTPSSTEQAATPVTTGDSSPSSLSTAGSTSASSTGSSQSTVGATLSSETTTEGSTSSGVPASTTQESTTQQTITEASSEATGAASTQGSESSTGPAASSPLSASVATSISTPPPTSTTNAGLGSTVPSTPTTDSSTTTIREVTTETTAGTSVAQEEVKATTKAIPSETTGATTPITLETAPGKIEIKVPGIDAETVTPNPDDDLTAAPSKQQRLPPTDVPAQPEASTLTPRPSEEETTKDIYSLPEKPTPSPVTLGPNNITKCVSSDECGDDALCERRTGACRCLPGFQGVPPSTPCSDVDECAEGLHKCHDSARCHNIVGTYACFCPMGYRKNESGACIDIDECAESRGNCCSLNGTCVNKQGSYGCECKPGFFGDGYNCMPVEKRVCTETELDKAGCGQHHVCMVDGLGGADCNTCKMGFKMVNGNCTDVNECAEPELNMCSRSADCNNLLGTYACSCKQGFKGDGYMCEDIDECSGNPCHPQAECENLLGSFKCSCPSGFTGDGIKECQNPLEKSCENVKEFCGRIEHVACLSVRIFNGSLSSVCECEPGFRFNKEQNKCEDINECDENRHNCDPASSACVNEEGGFHCECAEGYEGVGGVCVDVNECERGTAGCHSMAMCLNQPGSCGCKCMHGFTGDGIQCNPLQKREEKENNACTAEWDRLCLLENKTCHVDEEDVPQCGSCIEGHHPINGSCQPVHGAGTCSDPKKNSCDKNAECIDIPGTPGKHFCTCKKGFIGDGLRCDDIDECSLTGICHLHATCKNIPGSFNCICNTGYTGNGFTCTKEAGPNCHLNGELCHKDAECTMDGQCKCKNGFEGDGFKECTEVGSAPTTTAEVAGETTTTGKAVTPTATESTVKDTTTTEPLILTGDTRSSTQSTATPTGPMTSGIVTEIENPESVEIIPGSARINLTGVTTTTAPTTSTPASPTQKISIGPEPPTTAPASVSKTTHQSGRTTTPAPVTSTVIHNETDHSVSPNANVTSSVTEKELTSAIITTDAADPTKKTTLTGFDSIDQRTTTPLTTTPQWVSDGAASTTASIPETKEEKTTALPGEGTVREEATTTRDTLSTAGETSTFEHSTVEAEESTPVSSSTALLKTSTETVAISTSKTSSNATVASVTIPEAEETESSVVESTTGGRIPEGEETEPTTEATKTTVPEAEEPETTTTREDTKSTTEVEATTKSTLTTGGSETPGSPEDVTAGTVPSSTATSSATEGEQAVDISTTGAMEPSTTSTGLPVESTALLTSTATVELSSSTSGPTTIGEMSTEESSIAPSSTSTESVPREANTTQSTSVGPSEEKSTPEGLEKEPKEQSTDTSTGHREPVTEAATRDSTNTVTEEPVSNTPAIISSAASTNGMETTTTATSTPEGAKTIALSTETTDKSSEVPVESTTMEIIWSEEMTTSQLEEENSSPQGTTTAAVDLSTTVSVREGSGETTFEETTMTSSGTTVADSTSVLPSSEATLSTASSVQTSEGSREETTPAIETTEHATETTPEPSSSSPRANGGTSEPINGTSEPRTSTLDETSVTTSPATIGEEVTTATESTTRTQAGTSSFAPLSTKDEPLESTRTPSTATEVSTEATPLSTTPEHPPAATIGSTGKDYVSSTPETPADSATKGQVTEGKPTDPATERPSTAKETSGSTSKEVSNSTTQEPSSSSKETVVSTSVTFSTTHESSSPTPAKTVASTRAERLVSNTGRPVSSTTEMSAPPTTEAIDTTTPKTVEPVTEEPIVSTNKPAPSTTREPITSSAGTTAITTTATELSSKEPIVSTSQEPASAATETAISSTAESTRGIDSTTPEQTVTSTEKSIASTESEPVSPTTEGGVIPENPSTAGGQSGPTTTGTPVASTTEEIFSPTVTSSTTQEPLTSSVTVTSSPEGSDVPTTREPATSTTEKSVFSPSTESFDSSTLLVSTTESSAGPSTRGSLATKEPASSTSETITSTTEETTASSPKEPVASTAETPAASDTTVSKEVPIDVTSPATQDLATSATPSPTGSDTSGKDTTISSTQSPKQPSSSEPTAAKETSLSPSSEETSTPSSTQPTRPVTSTEPSSSSSSPPSDVASTRNPSSTNAPSKTSSVAFQPTALEQVKNSLGTTLETSTEAAPSTSAVAAETSTREAVEETTVESSPGSTESPSLVTTEEAGTPPSDTPSSLLTVIFSSTAAAIEPSTGHLPASSTTMPPSVTVSSTEKAIPSTASTSGQTPVTSSPRSSISEISTTIVGNNATESSTPHPAGASTSSTTASEETSSPSTAENNPTERSTTVELTPSTSGLSKEVTDSVSSTVTTPQPTDQPSSTRDSTTVSVPSVSIQSTQLFTSNAAPPSMTPPNFETTELAPTTDAEMYGSTTPEDSEPSTRITSTVTASTTTGENSTTQHSAPITKTPSTRTFRTTEKGHGDRDSEMSTDTVTEGNETEFEDNKTTTTLSLLTVRETDDAGSTPSLDEILLSTKTTAMDELLLTATDSGRTTPAEKWMSTIEPERTTSEKTSGLVTASQSTSSEEKWTGDIETTTTVREETPVSSTDSKRSASDQRPVTGSPDPRRTSPRETTKPVVVSTIPERSTGTTDSRGITPPPAPLKNTTTREALILSGDTTSSTQFSTTSNSPMVSGIVTEIENPESVEMIPGSATIVRASSTGSPTNKPLTSSTESSTESRGQATTTVTQQANSTTDEPLASSTQPQEIPGRVSDSQTPLTRQSVPLTESVRRDPGKTTRSIVVSTTTKSSMPTAFSATLPSTFPGPLLTTTTSGVASFGSSTKVGTSPSTDKPEPVTEGQVILTTVAPGGSSTIPSVLTASKPVASPISTTEDPPISNPEEPPTTSSKKLQETVVPKSQTSVPEKTPVIILETTTERSVGTTDLKDISHPPASGQSGKPPSITLEIASTAKVISLSSTGSPTNEPRTTSSESLTEQRAATARESSTAEEPVEPEMTEMLVLDTQTPLPDQGPKAVTELARVESKETARPGALSTATQSSMKKVVSGNRPSTEYLLTSSTTELSSISPRTTSPTTDMPVTENQAKSTVRSTDSSTNPSVSIASKPVILETPASSTGEDPPTSNPQEPHTSSSKEPGEPSVPKLQTTPRSHTITSKTTRNSSTTTEMSDPSIPTTTSGPITSTLQEPTDSVREEQMASTGGGAVEPITERPNVPVMIEKNGPTTVSLTTVRLPVMPSKESVFSTTEIFSTTTEPVPSTTGEPTASSTRSSTDSITTGSTEGDPIVSTAIVSSGTEKPADIKAIEPTKKPAAPISSKPVPTTTEVPTSPKTSVLGDHNGTTIGTSIVSSTEEIVSSTVGGARLTTLEPLTLSSKESVVSIFEILSTTRDPSSSTPEETGASANDKIMTTSTRDPLVSRTEEPASSDTATPAVKEPTTTDDVSSPKGGLIDPVTQRPTTRKESNISTEGGLVLSTTRMPVSSTPGESAGQITERSTTSTTKEIGESTAGPVDSSTEKITGSITEEHLSSTTGLPASSATNQPIRTTTEEAQVSTTSSTAEPVVPSSEEPSETLTTATEAATTVPVEDRTTASDPQRAMNSTINTVVDNSGAETSSPRTNSIKDEEEIATTTGHMEPVRASSPFPSTKLLPHDVEVEENMVPNGGERTGQPEITTAQSGGDLTSSRTMPPAETYTSAPERLKTKAMGPDVPTRGPPSMRPDSFEANKRTTGHFSTKGLEYTRVKAGPSPAYPTLPPLEYVTSTQHTPTSTSSLAPLSATPSEIRLNGSYVPETVTDDGVEVRNEPVGQQPEIPQREGQRAICSADDRSRCHEFAICDLSTSSCRCKDGFEGDGYTSCSYKLTNNCVANSSLCHSDAFCDRHVQKCSCNAGYIGDGILCAPDPQDCILRKDLCSPDATCSGRRCHCIAGFTGDGVKCVSLHQRSANCSECDTNAHCDQGVCTCNVGYFGNGLCCVPDPRDCVHFPGICHPEATCDSQNRQCACRKGYLGDGISCFPAVSCVTDPSVCHKNAICLPSGHCMCRNGFEGNGHSCQQSSALGLRAEGHDVPSLCGNKCNRESELCIDGECVCKHGFKKINNICEDVDECLKSPCHQLASCQNTRGSYSCACPEGHVGDGKTCIQHLKIGELGVFCENDGMTLVLSNETQMFEGKMYVRGQAENPHCIKTFSPLQQHSRPYTFKVFFEHCNVQLLENNTFAATVIVQKHPHFITTSADSYELKCTYSPDITKVQSHVNVSELAPTSTLSNQFEGPTCSLKITDDHNDFVESAKVGQSMVLRLEVAPNGTYGILPRDCVAVNIETGERYQLTDRHGCAVDDQLFPEFIQVHPSATEAVFRTFKWPDSSMIRFQCDCKACVGSCPTPDCHRLQKKSLPRFRRAHQGENEEMEIDSQLEAVEDNMVDTKRKAFSRLLAVHEDAEEQMAQEEVQHWSRSMLSESLPAVSRSDTEGVCVRAAVLAGASLLLILSLGFLTSVALSRRRSTPSKSPDSPVSVISF